MENRSPSVRKPPRPQTRILWLGLLAGLPALLVAEVLLWRPSAGQFLGGDPAGEAQWTLSFLLVACWWGFTWAARERTLFSLGTFANLLAALREGDYSVRARGGRHGDAFGELAAEINLLSGSLRQQRVGGLEAGALLDKVVEAIDIAVFAFDDDNCLRLVNPAGARLLAAGSEQLLGQSALQLQLDAVLAGPAASLVEATFPCGPGRWDIRHAQFRQDGRPHQILIVSDLSQPLREEERLAWWRLIRVLGHEINNSLAPVMSLADSLGTLLADPQAAEDWRDDMTRGLGVISARAGALNRFMGAYTQMAKLPAPMPQAIAVRERVQSAVRLERRLSVEIRSGPELTLEVDPDQLDQILINLLRNAVDAALETGGRVQIGWEANLSWLEIWVRDEGRGLAATSNLFVPFFTTKPGGSGIGLVLSRQIAEAHGGRLTLANRPQGPGCEARLYLPLR